MKEIALNITTKSDKEFKIKLEDDFAQAFERDLQKYFDGKTQFDTKQLLYAFMDKCHENYKQEAHLSGIVGNLEKTLDEI